MIRITALLIILSSTSTCFATGWNDFTLDIGDGYTVVRCNSTDVCIGKTDKSLILCPRDHDSVGPVSRYITTPKYILTKNLGRKPRNLFEGDTFQDVDASREFFFIITKGTDEVHGPFSASEFIKRPEIAKLGPLDWEFPQNPNSGLAILGTLLFIAISIPILAIKYFWISLPILLGVVLLVRYLKPI